MKRNETMSIETTLNRIANNPLLQKSGDPLISFNDSVQHAEKLEYTPTIRNIVTNPAFNLLPPSVIFDHFDEHGLPFGRHASALWIEGPTFFRTTHRENKNVGMLLTSENDNEILFKLTLVDHGKTNDFANADERAEYYRTIRERGVWNHMIYAGPQKDDALFYVRSYCKVRRDPRGLISSRLVFSGSQGFDNLRAGGTGHSNIQHMESSHRVAAIIALRMLMLISMSQNRSSRTVVLPAMPRTLPPASAKKDDPFIKPVMRQLNFNAKTAQEFIQARDADTLCRLLGLPDQAQRDAAPILPMIKRLKNISMPNEETIMVKQMSEGIEEVPTMVFDNSFHDVTKQLAALTPPHVVRELLATSGLMFNKLWIEGPFDDPRKPALKTSKVPFMPRIGALVEETEEGLVLRMVETVRVPTTIPASQLYNNSGKIEVPDRILGFDPVTHMIPYDPNEPVTFEDPKLSFIASSLLLTRTHDVLLQQSNMGPIFSERRSTPRDQDLQSQGVRLKLPFIRNAKATAKPIAINIAKARSKVVPLQERAFVLSEECVSWENEKTRIRASVGDVLNKENFGVLFDKLNQAAKKLFGSFVTVQILHIPESRPILKSVNPGTFTRPEHIRINLVYELQDQAYLAFKRAAYWITAKLTGNAPTDKQHIHDLALSIHPEQVYRMQQTLISAHEPN